MPRHGSSSSPGRARLIAAPTGTGTNVPLLVVPGRCEAAKRSFQRQQERTHATPICTHRDISDPAGRPCCRTGRWSPGRFGQRRRGWRRSFHQVRRSLVRSGHRRHDGRLHDRPRVMLTKLVTAAAAVALFAPGSTALAAGTGSGADLQVSGSSSVGSPVQGQPYVYTYQVKNSGPQDASSVTFTDDLAAGTLSYAAVNG